jgi:sulfur carrier protein ThiS adenylyltransferase
MNRFEQGLTRYFAPSDLKKIRRRKIGIAGAGGLGSNCAMNLLRSGFHDFVIADHDRIDESNLNRQFFFLEQTGSFKVSALRENLLKINPDASVSAFSERIDPSNMERLFGECDVIVEAFDDPAAKKLIVEHFIHSGKLVVAASGIAGCGSTDGIQTRKINDTFYIVGDFVSESSEALPPYSPGVSIAAAKQADIVLTHTLNQGTQGAL